MRQGYFLIIKMGDSNLDMKSFCREDLFPYCVFTAGEVEAQEVRFHLSRFMARLRVFKQIAPSWI